MEENKEQLDVWSAILQTNITGQEYSRIKSVKTMKYKEKVEEKEKEEEKEEEEEDIGQGR